MVDNVVRPILAGKKRLPRPVAIGWKALIGAGFQPAYARFGVVLGDLVLDKRRRRGAAHELAVYFR